MQKWKRKRGRLWGRLWGPVRGRPSPGLSREGVVRVHASSSEKKRPCDRAAQTLGSRSLGWTRGSVTTSATASVAHVGVRHPLPCPPAPVLSERPWEGRRRVVPGGPRRAGAAAAGGQSSRRSSPEPGARPSAAGLAGSGAGGGPGVDAEDEGGDLFGPPGVCGGGPGPAWVGRCLRDTRRPASGSPVAAASACGGSSAFQEEAAERRHFLPKMFLEVLLPRVRVRKWPSILGAWCVLLVDRLWPWALCKGHAGREAGGVGECRGAAASRGAGPCRGGGRLGLRLSVLGAGVRVQHAGGAGPGCAGPGAAGGGSVSGSSPGPGEEESRSRVQSWGLPVLRSTRPVGSERARDPITGRPRPWWCRTGPRSQGWGQSGPLPRGRAHRQPRGLVLGGKGSLSTGPQRVGRLRWERRLPPQSVGPCSLQAEAEWGALFLPRTSAASPWGSGSSGPGPGGGRGESRAARP